MLISCCFSAFYLIWIVNFDDSTEWLQIQFLLSRCNLASISQILGIGLLTFVLNLSWFKIQVRQRKKELFIRRLLGDSRLRLLLMLFMELFIFAIAGILLGLVLTDMILPVLKDPNIADLENRGALSFKLSLYGLIYFAAGFAITVIPIILKGKLTSSQ